MDPATIDAARRGDRDAQGRLLTALQDVWFRFALGLLDGDPDRAADATQETALRFLKQIGGFRGESQLQTWSLGIALNVTREMKRKRASVRQADDPDSAERGSAGSSLGNLDLIERADDAAMLKQTLATLPERQREAIVLRFFEELSVEQTAAAMGCATGTVKATVYQALKALKQKMSSPS